MDETILGGNVMLSTDQVVLYQGRCEHCGAWKRVSFTADPFAEEIDKEIIFSWWCEECYAEACDDI
jgi:hypothetical protein